MRRGRKMRRAIVAYLYFLFCDFCIGGEKKAIRDQKRNECK